MELDQNLVWRNTVIKIIDPNYSNFKFNLSSSNNPTFFESNSEL